MANTTRGELKRLVISNLHRADGEAILTVEQAINNAQKIIASIHDFDDLMVLDTTNAFTVVHQKSYHVVNDLKLVRPKDIYSVRYMDEGDSRKLTYVPFRELDSRISYTEIVGYGRPSWYTTRGMNMELFRIPDEVKPLYIMHSQWPAILDDDSDYCSYANLDTVIVGLASDMASASLEGGVSDWIARAQKLLGLGLGEEITRPDRTLVAQPFNSSCKAPLGEYWNNPFVKSQP